LTTHSILNSAALYTWLLFCALSGFQETSIRAVTETFARKGNRLLRSLRGITIRRLCRLEGEEIVSSWLTLNKGQWMRKTDKAWQNFVQIDHCYGACQKTESAPFTSTYAIHAPGWRRLLRELLATFPLINGLTNLVKGDSFRRPYIEMHSYNVNRFLLHLREQGCHCGRLRFYDHGLYKGKVLLFKKETLPLS
jgi:hypothetical protein